MDRQQQKPKKHTPKKFGAGIALDKFGKMKKSSFDKRAKLEKESKLNAARVNKYKKLKAKLADKLQPKVKLNEDLSLEGEDEQQPSSSALEEQHVQQNAAAEQPGEQQPQQHPGHAQLEGQGGRGGRKDGRSTSGRGKHKLPSHMQRIAAKVQAEKEAKQRDREERQRAAAERAAKLAADAKQRAAKSKQLYKKTGHGQPVMKYRVEKMLQQLQSGQS